MTPFRTLLAFLALGMASCVGPEGLPRPPLPPLPPLPPFPGVPSAPSPPGSYDSGTRSYAPDEYRSGYDIGNHDAAYGYPADSRRAFDRFGHDSESTFNEGYVDGYERRSPRR